MVLFTQVLGLKTVVRYFNFKRGNVVLYVPQHLKAPLSNIYIYWHKIVLKIRVSFYFDKEMKK